MHATKNDINARKTEEKEEREEREEEEEERDDEEDWDEDEDDGDEENGRERQSKWELAKAPSVAFWGFNIRTFSILTETSTK